MRVLIDSQCFYFISKGGISRYFAELIRAWQHHPDIEVVFQSHPIFEFFAHGKSVPKDMKGIRRLRYERDKIKNRRFIKKQLVNKQFDLFIPTYYDHYFLEHLNNTPYINVVHDMIPEERFSSQFNSLIAHKKELCEKAKGIVCVSHHTKNKLTEHYPQLINKPIAVIYHGSSLKKIQASPIKVPQHFFLYVGHRNGYKNYSVLLDAFTVFAQKNPDHYLLLVGGDSLSRKEIEQINQHQLTNKIIHLQPDDQQLKFLYEHAIGLIFPSVDEGFGIPIVEAAQNNCLLILSDIEVFHEVSGENAFFFNPQNPNQLQAQMQKAIEEDCSDMKEAAMTFCSKYQWKKTVEVTTETIKKWIE